MDPRGHVIGHAKEITTNKTCSRLFSAHLSLGATCKAVFVPTSCLALCGITFTEPIRDCLAPAGNFLTNPWRRRLSLSIPCN